ncbi:MAG: sulfatase-like hydrolase/transferase [Hyphomicrobiaceae bacterium]|nr:sulfatase-like hydrolase/transferase [Hyphomicrobiaceae bacterium]MCC0008124.1 sulfatase-like hydrolase/transferase [Hyphomicrobiaceae bacterium]
MSIDNASRDVGAASVRRSASALSGVTGLGWAWWVTGLLLLAMGAYFVRHEGWPANVVFTMALTGVLISILILATRRVLFATSVVAAAVAVIVIAATIKYSYMGMVLHAYDVAFYLFSRDTLWYLWIDFRAELITLVVVMVVLAVGGYLLYRTDPTRMTRRVSGSLLAVLLLVSVAADYLRGQRPHTLFYWDALFVSSFYSSWSETLVTLWRGQMIEASASDGSVRPFIEPTSCPVSRRPPHIILIHQESVVPPSIFPSINYDRSIDPLFRSGDGKVHLLRTETFGGASWLTEFSVLAGVSTYSFGGMRTFVQSMLQGKVHDSVTQSLVRCGYKNVMFYPVPKHFVSSGKFYASIGFDEINDYAAQKSKRYNERDRFYYKNALDRLDVHLTKSKGPLFSYILTSATHLPYTSPHSPEENVPGGRPGTEPQMHEYLRRLSLARIDLEWFRAELKRRFPNERFLIVQYGDHQPVVTRPHLGFGADVESQNVIMEPESKGFLTYYAAEGINFEVPQLPTVEVLDVPYLGTLMLQLAGLPLSPAQEERMRLLARCGGRYYMCPHSGEILAFHRRLIDSGLLVAR